MASTKIRGFTIVELLIAIVVIGILASISVITYGGVRSRAEDSAIGAKARGIIGIIETYGATTGGYVPRADWACIGEPEDFPATDGYWAEWCSKPGHANPIPTGNIHPISSTVNAKLKTVVDRVPNSNIPEVDYPGGYKLKGIFYDSNSDHTGGKPTLTYYLKGSRSSCPVGEVFMNLGVSTRCQYVFENLIGEATY